MARRHKRRHHSMGGHKRRHHMGRHHRRRHLRGLLGSTQTQAMIAGGVAGLAVTMGLKVLVSKLDVLRNNIPDVVQNNMILVGSLLTGGALYYYRKRKDPSAAKANLTGAALAGGVAWGWDALQSQLPNYFQDVVTLSLPGRKIRALKGVLVSQAARGFPPRGYGGTLVPQGVQSGFVDASGYVNQQGSESMGEDVDDPFAQFAT